MLVVQSTSTIYLQGNGCSGRPENNECISPQIKISSGCTLLVSKAYAIRIFIGFCDDIGEIWPSTTLKPHMNCAAGSYWCLFFTQCWFLPLIGFYFIIERRLCDRIGKIAHRFYRYAEDNIQRMLFSIASIIKILKICRSN